MNPPPERKSHCGWLTTLAVALLVLGHAVQDRWQYNQGSPVADFYIFWAAPQYLLFNPAANIYLPDAQKQMAEVLLKKASQASTRDEFDSAGAAIHLGGNTINAAGSPFLYATTGLLSSGNFVTDKFNFLALCLACYCLALLILCRLSGYSPVAIAVLLTLFCYGFSPMFSDLRVGNLNQIQIMILAGFIFLAVKSKPFLAGLVLGLGIMLKPNILMVLPLALIALFLNRRHRSLLMLSLGVAAGGLVAVGVSSAYFNRNGLWVDFLRSLPKTVNLTYPVEKGNIGLPAIVHQKWAFNVATPLLLAFFAAFSFVVYRSRKKPETVLTGSQKTPAACLDVHEAMIVGGLGYAVMLVTSGLVWTHYYVLLIPLILHVLRPDAKTRLRTTGQVIGLVTLVVMARFLEILPDQVKVFEPLSYNLATLALVGFTLFEFWSLRRSTAARA